MKIKSLLGTSILGLIIIFSLAGPLLSPFSAQEIHLSDKNLPPSSSHWFGTDDLGRDMFVRTAEGARISLFVGSCAALIDILIGVCYGAAAALGSERKDELLMRLADVLNSLPYVLVAVLLLLLIGNGLTSIILALSLIGWIPMARIMRGHFMQLNLEDYVSAARAMGAGKKHIFFTHLLPNSTGPILVTLLLSIPSAIYLEAFLSFLGLGVQAPQASWGTLASEGLPALGYYPARLLIPAACICLTLLSMNLICEGLREKYRLRSEF